MVERKMQITVPIHHHTDDIMRIGYISFILTAVQRPFGTPQCTFTYGQISIGIVIRYIYCTPPSVTSELLRNTVVLTEVELYPSPTLTRRCAEIPPQMRKPIKNSKMRFIVYLLSILCKSRIFR